MFCCSPVLQGLCRACHDRLLIVAMLLLQMEGPSPLLPAWLDFWLQPSRAAWNRGLKSGASPLLLPPQSTASSQDSTEEEAKYPVSPICLSSTAFQYRQRQQASATILVSASCKGNAEAALSRASAVCEICQVICDLLLWTGFCCAGHSRGLWRHVTNRKSAAEEPISGTA